MKKRVKWLLWGFVGLALISSFVYSITRPLGADLFEVKPQTLEKKFTEAGMVNATWQQEFFSLFGGQVLAVKVQEGDSVALGELLLVLDTKELDYRLAELQGQLLSLEGQEKQAFSGPKETEIARQRLALELAQEQLKAAQEDYQRTEALYAAGTVSQLNLEEAARTVKQLKLLTAQQEQGLKLLQEDSAPAQGTKEQFSGLKAALQAQMALLTYQKGHAQLKAPAAAHVGQVQVKEGTVVVPGAPLFSLFQPGEYEIEVFILPEDLAQVEPGQEVRVTYKGLDSDKVFQGEVKRMASTAEERVSTLGLLEPRVKVLVSLFGEVSRLRPGYAMDVTFITERAINQLVIPKTALFKEAGQNAVWVLHKGKARIQVVEIGLETDDAVAISNGLSEGDLVIRNTRLTGLKPGVRIRPLNP